MSETVAIEIQLEGDRIINCEIVITHTNRPHFGGRITQILPEDQRLLALYIERLVRSSITRPSQTP
jgi:hypothetical protein